MHASDLQTTPWVSPQAHDQPDQRDSAGRILWIDVARGICMLLVVCMHFDEMLFSRIVSFAPAEKMWDVLSSAARPARIPAFFLLSGLLASSSLMRPLSAVFEKRMLIQYYAFVVWSFIHLLAMSVIFWNPTKDVLAGALIAFAARNISNLVWPMTQVWFLFALPVFFALAWLTRRMPKTVLTVSLVVSCFSQLVDDTTLSLMLRSFAFFLIGCHFPLFVKRVALGSRPFYLISLLGAYATAVALILVLGEEVPGIWLPATIFGIALVICVSAILQRTVLGSLLAFIGKRTLPIYVLHGLLLLIIGHLLGGYQLPGGSSFWNAVQLAFPPIGIVGLVSLCLFLHAGLMKVGAEWLFTVPDWLKTFADRRVQGACNLISGRAAA